MSVVKGYPFGEVDYGKIYRHDLPLKLHEAIRFAEDRYLYMSAYKIADIRHPMEVLQILMGQSWTIETAIAGVLHDVLEETDCTAEEIEKQFGSRVRYLVEANTEYLRAEAPEGPWRICREKAVERIRVASKEVRQIALADYISSLRDMVYDYGCFGEELWERVSVDKNTLCDYYLNVIDAFEELQGYEDTRHEYWELNSLFKHLFVDYFIQEEGIKQTIYQVMKEEIYQLENGAMIWRIVKSIPENARKISKLEAECLEDTWNAMLNGDSF